MLMLLEKKSFRALLLLSQQWWQVSVPKFKPCVLPCSYLGGERSLCCAGKLRLAWGRSEGLALLGHTQHALGQSTAQAMAHPKAWPAQRKLGRAWNDRRSSQLFL